MNKFWDSNIGNFDKKVLIVPNYTHFGDNKNINADSFVLVMKSFLDNSSYDNLQFIIPYPNLLPAFCVSRTCLSVCPATRSVCAIRSFTFLFNSIS